MRNKNIWILGVILLACADGREAKLQRFLLQGNSMVEKRNYQEAKRYFSEAVKLDSCFADAWNNLGTVYYNEGNYSEALASFDRALECHPDFYDVYINRANTYYELNNQAFALRDLDTYGERKPDTAIVFFSRGLIYTS